MRQSLVILLLLTATSLAASDKYPINPNLDVRHYLFILYLADNTDEISGETTVTADVINSFKTLRLDLKGVSDGTKGMKVSSVMIETENIRFEQNERALFISPEGGFKGGSTVDIKITYSGIPADGLIISENRYGERTFFADNWPDRASNWLPCVDHPSDKAKVDFIVYAPSHYKVVSNGYLVEESWLNDSTSLTHWREEVDIPTKVMVIGVARFAVTLAGTIDGTEIRTWVYPRDREAGFSDYSVALKPFEWYSNVIGTYPYEKLANVQSKTIFGGMENAGAIFYSERSVSGEGRAEGLMAHEIAHQWFGNSVSEADWHHVWLSEGFATYLTACYNEASYGTDRFKEIMTRSRNRIISAYEREPAPVVDTTITDLMDLLSTWSYQKGAWVLHMIRTMVGDENFFEGLRLYYNRFKNANALTGDFVAVMEEVSGQDLDQFTRQWLYGTVIPKLETNWWYDRKQKIVHLDIKQVQEGDVFVFPLEVMIDSGDEPEKLNFIVDKRTENILYRAEVKPREIILDPNVKLLFR